jgi:hypothetical protein
VEAYAAAAATVRLDRIPAFAQVIEVAEHAARAHGQRPRQLRDRDAWAVAEHAGQHVEPIYTLHV